METCISVLIWQTCWAHGRFSISLSNLAENSLPLVICIMQLHVSQATDYSNRVFSWLLSVLHTNVGSSNLHWATTVSFYALSSSFSTDVSVNDIVITEVTTGFKCLKQAMKLGRGEASLRLGEALIYIRVETPTIKKKCRKRD